MGRAAKHNWKKLYLEYCQGRYKNVAEFAKKKNLHPVAVRREFGKLKKSSDDQPETQQNVTKNHNKTQQYNRSKYETKQNNPHPWETLKAQFTDWPEEKLQAYLVQLEGRKTELEAIPFEELIQEEIKELGQIRRERRAILSNPDPEVKCSAHNRDGSPCQNPAERGKRVCWNHGGAPGSGTQPGQKHALKHGFYSRIMPDDPEISAIIEEIDAKSPLEMLWDQIVLQYAQIARAQKLMYVKNQGDIVKHLKKKKDGDTFLEREWEFQYPWDRHAAFLTAQSKAMATLERLIARYESMANEEEKLRLAKLRQDMEIDRERLQLEKTRVLGGTDETEDDGFIDALHGKAGEAWDGYTEEAEG